ncbi:MAG: UTP--glucose-1-phosphate uridylyltransferase [Roseiflexaceae bacterium]
MSLAQFTERMRAAQLDEAAIAAFADAYTQLASGATGMMPEASIVPVTQLPQLSDLVGYAQAGRAALPHTIVLRLNGGLGTGMGLEQAKSLLRVRNGDTFLDIVAKQHRVLMAQTGVDLPLLFMNSFATDADTRALLARYPDVMAQYVIQGRVPKVRADTLAPIDWPAHPALEWCPPGHGELYRVLWSSGVLDALITDGYEYLFSANIDNLGATPDTAILGYMATHQIPFLMEVTARTDADRKGGHLAHAEGGRLVLRESAQCPAADMDAFQDITRHQYFNTNNVWLALRPLRDLLAQHGGFLPLPIIVNRKTVDVRDATSPAVIQLESAMGAAIGLIAGAQAVAVPRTRFMPVKNCQDLLVLRSDCFMVNDQYHVVPVDDAPLPIVTLDQRFYRIIADFEDRFAAGVPSLRQCQSLVVEGDITFAADVHVRGDVVLHASQAVRLVAGAQFQTGTYLIQ